MFQTLCVVITFDKCVTLTLMVINLIYIYALFKMLVNCKKLTAYIYPLVFFFFFFVTFRGMKQNNYIKA